MPYANRYEGKRPSAYPSGSTSEKLTEQALALAAQGEWAQAAKANRELLSSHPRDIRSLNRMGKCLTELGDYRAATAAYSRTLEFDQQNDIARKNLRRLTVLAENTAPGTAAPVTTQHNLDVETGRSTVGALQEPIDYEATATFSPGTDVIQSDTQAGLAPIWNNPHPFLEEDADEDDEVDEEEVESRAVAVPAETDYPEAELSDEERDPFANEAPRMQKDD